MFSNDAIYYLILGWIPISAAIFAVAKPVKALMIVYLVGWLALPAYEIEVKGFWDMGKVLSTNMGAILGVLLFAPNRLRGFRPHAADIFMACYAVGTCLTSMLNDLGTYDGVSSMCQELLHYGVPYFLGRTVLRERRDFVDAARYMVYAAGITGCLAIWEWRMSPQIHSTIYGGFQHSWQQHARWGFHRPIICFPHALGLAMFLVWTALLGVAMYSARCLRPAMSLPPFAWVAPIVGGVAVSMSFGPWLLFALGLVALRIWQRAHNRVLLWVMVGVVGLWVTGRYAGLVRGTELVQATAHLSSERSDSLNYRIRVEDALIEHAKERPWFGWGGFGRNRIEDSEDAVDGLWINMVGMNGIIGLALFFAWWLWPIQLTRSLGRELDADPVLAALVVAIGLVGVNFLFNNFLDPPLMVLGGAAAANLLRMRQERSARARAASVAGYPAQWATSPAR
jgi:hypothetical protein